MQWVERLYKINALCLQLPYRTIILLSNFFAHLIFIYYHILYIMCIMT